MRIFLPALIATAPLLAQAPIHATPAGQKLMAWLDNFNAGDTVRIEKYARENYSAGLLKETSSEQFARMDTGA